MPLEIIILAAGQGTRMRSQRPKVLQRLGGRPLIGHLLETAQALAPEQIHLVVGQGAADIQAYLADAPLHYVFQAEQRGTGHAVQQALSALSEDSRVLILYGDVPLLSKDTLSRLLALVTEHQLALLTVERPDPEGYGRILRTPQGRVDAIVEHRDATPEQLAIQEVNTGILAATSAHLRRWLPQLNAQNAQGEYYLTDLVALAAQAGVAVATLAPQYPEEVQGVNDPLQLAQLERLYQRRQAERLMQAGLFLADPARFDLRGQLTVGRDVFVDVGCLFEGQVVLGDGVVIGPYCHLKNCRLGPGVQLASHSLLEETELEGENLVGPFARLRPGTYLEKGAKVGNFVETKKARLGAGAKANHLSYLGDVQVGAAANIGAGTITCNYDGVNKHATHIGAGAFIGSNSSLVAPLRIGAGATIGAGSTLTRDVPDQTLAVTRIRPLYKAGWPAPKPLNPPNTNPSKKTEED